MCGTLKNIVALGAGVVDGLDLGPNSKATIIRQGLVEMRDFTKALYPAARDDTFLECCGVGDLVATCTGGRNRLVAQEWAKAQMVRQGGNALTSCHQPTTRTCTPGQRESWGQGTCAAAGGVQVHSLFDIVFAHCTLQAGTPRTFAELEDELLKGQKLQGVMTCNEVQEILKVSKH